MVAVIMLGYKARRRHGYKPLLVGMVAVAAIVGGKFYLADNFIEYAGIFILIAASVWNAWPLPSVVAEEKESP